MRRTVLLWMLVGAAAQGTSEGVRLFADGEFEAAARRLVSTTDPVEQYVVGLMHEHGYGVQRDPAAAARWYTAATARDVPGAHYRLGLAYWWGRGVPTDLARAARHLRAAATRDHRRAMDGLGYAYAKGAGVDADMIEAYAWFTLAGDVARGNLAWAARNLDDAQRRAGQERAAALRSGITAAPDGPDVADAEEAAFRKGNDAAVRRDAESAKRYLQPLVENGHAKSLVVMGDMVGSGLGHTADLTRAATFYTRAARKGDPVGLLRLGYAYVNGHGVTANRRRGVEFFQAAAWRGDATAMENTGWSYARGDTVSANAAEAYAWLTLAQRYGGRNAADWLRHLGAGAAEPGKRRAAEIEQRMREGPLPPLPEFDTAAALRPVEPKALPDGFRPLEVAAGVAFVAETRDAASATRQLRATLDALAGFFDARPYPEMAIRSADDRHAEATFVASHGGRTVRGVILSAAGARGRAGVAFDGEERIDETVDSLIAKLRATVPSSGGAEPSKVEWVDAMLPDGSGRMRLPRGWRITSAWKGAVDVVGDRGEGMTLGYAIQVVTPAGNWGGRAAIASPLVRPAEAKARIWPQRVAAIRRTNPRTPPMRFGRVIEAKRTPWTAGGEAAYMLWSWTLAGKEHLAFSLVGVQPINAERWLYYDSTVSAPAATITQAFPVLLEAWGTWKVADHVFRERRDAAMKSMEETTKLLRGAHEYRVEVFDQAMAKWSGYMRTRHKAQKATVQLPNGAHVNVTGFTDAEKAANHLNWKAWQDGKSMRFQPVPDKDVK